MTTRATAALIAFAAFAIETTPAGAQSVDVAPEATTPAADVQAADFPTGDGAQVTNWVIATHDNGDLPFIVIDKVGAEMFVFDRNGQPLGRAPVLVGIAKGDDSTPGVGDRELSHIPVSQRTTPAGRFLAKFGAASGHAKGVLWVDYKDAISLHPVVTAHPKEHRMQRINSATPDDNRITFGCINAPAAFYNSVVEPLFRKTGGMVYVLPETKPLHEVFAAMPGQDLPSNAATISQ